jgi:CRP/FNR family transcriptional regulator, anaerobic regulatory protein
MKQHRSPCGACLDCDVRHTAICAALADDEVAELEAIMTGRQLAGEEMLVQAGDRLTRVYSLTSGMLRLSIDLPDGRRQITGFLMPGDYLGLAEEEVHSATAEAVAPSRLCSFPVADMHALMARFPRLQERLNRFTRSALRQARDNQMILGRLTPVEKLASFLLSLSHRAAAHGGAASPVALPMSRTDIADYLGLTIETVSRSFTKLRAAGLIRLPDSRTVEIPAPDALAERAGMDFR